MQFSIISIAAAALSASLALAAPAVQARTNDVTVTFHGADTAAFYTQNIPIGGGSVPISKSYLPELQSLHSKYLFYSSQHKTPSTSAFHTSAGKLQVLTAASLVPSAVLLLALVLRSHTAISSLALLSLSLRPSATIPLRRLLWFNESRLHVICLLCINHLGFLWRTHS